MSKLLNLVGFVETTAWVLESEWPELFPGYVAGCVDEAKADAYEKELKRLRTRVQKLKEYAETLANPTPEQAAALVQKVTAMHAKVHAQAVDKLAREKKFTTVHIMREHTACYRGGKKVRCAAMAALALSWGVIISWSATDGWS